MNLYIRLFFAMITALFAPKIKNVLEPAHLSMRVLPNDLDLNFHMNNGRYLTIMDIGRLDFILRCGIMGAMFKNKYAAVLSSAAIRYRRPLTVFQQFDLQTKVLAWDEKWVYIEQRFVIVSGPKKGAVAAIALLKGGFQDTVNKSMVKMPDLMQQIGLNLPSPPVPGHVLKWAEAEEVLRQQTAAGSTVP